MKPSLLLAFACLYLYLIVASSAAVAANLIANPGFETPLPSPGYLEPVGPYSTSWGSYAVAFSAPAGVCTGMASEALAGTYWGGGAVFHSGSEALRMYVYSQTTLPSPAHLTAAQYVSAEAGKDYVASAWVKTYSSGAGGFGSYTGEKAGIRVEECNSSGAVLATHTAYLIDATNNYRQVFIPFTTGAQCAALRFTLDTYLSCSYNLGHVTYDDCRLEQVLPPTTVSGTVVSGGQPVSGATVSVGDYSTVSQSDGTYSLQFSRSADYQLIRAEKGGFFAQDVRQVFNDESAVVNFDLMPVPQSDLLINGGFETAIPIWELSAPFSTSLYGWNYEVVAPGHFGIAPEAMASGWGGGARFEGGSNAIRQYLFADSAQNVHMKVWQDVFVRGDSDYLAVAWAKTWDSGTGGFGDYSTDSAGLVIIEYAANGSVIATHDKVAITQATMVYQPLQRQFHTDPNTCQIRFLLDTVVSGPYTAGHVSYDECVLSGPEPVGTKPCEAKKLADGSFVRLVDLGVTASYTGYFYAEDSERTGGIRVQGTATLGDVVNVTGTMATVDNERAVSGASVEVTGRGRPRAVCMNNKAIGGSTDGLNEGVTDGTGLNNIGLLVRTTGKLLTVTTGGDGFKILNIADGSAGNLKVTGVYGPLTLNQPVTVTGISSVTLVGTDRARRIRATGAEMVNSPEGITVTSTVPVTGSLYPPGLVRLNYTSAIDNYVDWAYALTPTSGDTWIVNLHGHGSSGDQLYTRPDIAGTWLPAFLARGMGILTPNLRGNAWMSPKAASDLHSLLEYVRQTYGAGRFVFVGGSMGGSSNLIYSVLHPEDVAGTMALCPSTDLITYYPWCVAQTSSAILQEIATAIRVSYGGLPTILQERYSAHSALLNTDRLTMPVFVSHGDADTIIPVSGARQLAAAMSGNPDFRYVEIPGGGHDAPLIAPFADGFAWLMSRVSP